MQPGLRDAGPDSRRHERSLYRATQALSNQLGDALWAAYRVGDDALHTIVDVTFDIVELSFTDVCRRASDWSGQAQETAVVVGSGLDLLWMQARNNFEVYSLVKGVRSRLHLDWDRPFDLGDLVQAAYGLGVYADLWAIEGLGHDYAAMCLDRRRAAGGILRDGPASALPAGSLTMMHAGLGLALAERLAPQLTPWSSAAEFCDVATQFIAACDAHSREGYVGAAYESLGLVVRTWHPRLVRKMDAALLAIDPGIAAYFWHGAGRALYFLPAYIVPGVLSPWRGADREAPHDLAHENLYAGLAWATTLVNLRQPDIMAGLLEVRGEALARSRGFSNGIASAIVVGIDTTPGDEYVLAFAAYDAATRRGSAADRWDAIVRHAATAAIRRYHPLLSKAGRLDFVFRHADLDALVSRLERGEAVAPVHSPIPSQGPVLNVATGATRPGVYPASAVRSGGTGP